MDFLLRVKQLSAGVLKDPGTRFMRDLAMLGLGQVGGKILIFLTFAYLARVLDPVGYGEVEFVIALTGLFVIICDLGLGPVGVRNWSGRSDELARMVPMIRLILSIAAVPIMIFVASVATDSNTALGLAILFSISIPIMALNQNWIQQAIERIDRVASGEFLRAAVFAALTILLVGGTDDLFLIGAAEIVSVIVFVCFFLFMQRRVGVPVRIGGSRGASLALTREALPLGASNLIWGITYYVPPIIVTAFAGLFEAALFAASLRLVVSVQSFSYIYHFNLFAALSRRFRQDPAAMAGLAQASFRVLSWALIGPALLVAAVAGDVTALIFGEPFRVAGPYLAVLIAALPIQFLAGHARWGLVAAGKNDAVFWAGLAGAVVSGIGLPVLTWWIGAMGAAIGVVLAALTIWIVADAQARRLSLDLPFLTRAGGPIAAGVAAAALTLVLPDWPWIIRAMLGMVLYCTLGGIFDRRILPDLRHLAYAKSDVV